MKRWLTTSNVLATIAVLVALTGASLTASAAIRKPVQYTGAHVKNNNLAGIDFKDGDISKSSFATSSQTRLKAKVGPQGAPGTPGAQGDPGSKGQKGEDGPDAARAYSYITAEDTTGMIKPKSGNLINPDPQKGDCNFASTFLPAAAGFTDADCSEAGERAWNPWFPHWAWDCDAFVPKYCGLDETIGAAGAGATMLQTGSDGVLGFTGDKNGSFVSSMSDNSKIIVTANLTLMRRTEGYHSRVSCQPRFRRSATSDQYTPMGVPTVVSSSTVLGIVNITATGGGVLPTPGNYDYEISCRLLDEYNTNSEFGDWFFISGNATATTTEM